VDRRVSWLTDTDRVASLFWASERLRMPTRRK